MNPGARRRWAGAGLTFALLLSMPALADTSLREEFLRPPDSARPWVYWFWLNGNITAEGITADLEAMKRVGIGGVLIMEVDQGAPVGPVDFMSPRWRELFKHVLTESARLGLEVNMNNDAGWNGSGGPWIKPEQSMKKVVWSEAPVQGPGPFEGTLPRPEAVAGYYRDIALLAVPAVGDYRIPNIRAKAAFDIGNPGTEARDRLAAQMIAPSARIRDISSRMDANGHVTWEAPEGRWTLIRFGYTSTGAVNAPSPKSGQGLEPDKLSRAGIEAAFAGMIQVLAKDAGPLAGKSLAATHIDSWENGSQNWTEQMAAEFRRRRGYDLLPYLPVMTGRVVESLAISERFLWDLRKTVSEMAVENYAGRMHELAAAAGLRFTVEAYGSPCDHLPYAGASDEPMGEFWVGGMAMETCRGMASAGHVYGKTIIGAEAFTAADQERWLEHPASIKALGDRAFCEGINRFVFHRYALQPWAQDRRPGMTMGPWGLHYERTQTWWEQSAVWHTYLARCQHLLRQGRFVADICHLQPEGSPQGFALHDRRGYDYDECPAELIMSSMNVRDGRLCLPGGMSYRVLVLPPGHMTPELLDKIKQLAEAGATVIGSPPARSPSLVGYPACDEKVGRLAAEIWGDCDGQRVKERRVGQGRIVRGIEPEKWLASAGVPADFTSQRRLRFIHRATDGLDIYFVANLKPAAMTASAEFRVTGRVPELWWPETGRIEPAAMYEVGERATRVSLPLGPTGSVFVVFEKPAGAADPPVEVRLDGRVIMTTREDPAFKIQVEKALYGVLGDPARTRDVTARVQSLVDAGEDRIPVSLMAQQEDPAVNVVKTLSVEYRLSGRTFTVKAQDGHFLHFPERAVQVKIEQASYGVPGDAQRTRDVREKLQRLFDAGENEFSVARLAEGDDPAYGIVKTLTFEYTLNSRRSTYTGRDGDIIELDPLEGTDAAVELVRGDDGQLRLLAGHAGRYTLSTAGGKTCSIGATEPPAPLDLSTDWSVSFDPAWGGPDQARFERLTSLKDHADPKVKYYAGPVNYRRSFDLPAGTTGTGQHRLLDLGRVAVMAEVSLNGRPLGLLWKPPYRTDVTDALKPGRNELEVKVVTLWPNRLIGDEQLPEDSERNPNGTLKVWPAWLLEGKPGPTGRFTFTSWRLWGKDSPLIDAGLIGPVTLSTVQELELTPQ